MDFDPVLLARLQFAFTIAFHIIFPSFTIGLSAYIATLHITAWLTGLAMASVIAELRTKADDIRQAEVNKTLRHLPDLTPAERQHIEQLAEALVNKLLHAPTGRLRAAAGSQQAAAWAAAAKALFALEG